MNTYGKCPQCGTDSISRERRPNGNDKCANGHTYPSANAIQSHSGGEAVATLNSSYGSDTGWQYLIDLRHDLQTDEYLESIHGHDIALYLANPDQSARIKELENNIKQLDVEFDQRDDMRLKQLAELQKQNDVMREALQLLRDNQNGCPLPKYENDWNEAMRLTDIALATVKGE